MALKINNDSLLRFINNQIKKADLGFLDPLDKAKVDLSKIQPRVTNHCNSSNNLGKMYSNGILSINLIEVSEEYEVEFLPFLLAQYKDTVNHEIAHFVCNSIGKGHGHDKWWQWVAYSLGANPRAIQKHGFFGGTPYIGDYMKFVEVVDPTKIYRVGNQQGYLEKVTYGDKRWSLEFTKI